MANGAYIGVDGTARKIRSLYVGVSGVARKIKKAYIGVGGVARLIFKSGSGTPGFYGATPTVAYTAHSVAASSVGSYGIFTGGATATATSSAAVTTACAYNTALTKTSLTALSSARCRHAGSPVGDYALFAGGAATNSTAGTTHATVDTYSSALTKGSAANLSYGRNSLAGASVGKAHAIFLGGVHPNTSAARTNVDSFNANLTMTKLDNCITTQDARGVSTENYAFFGGGTTGSAANDRIYKYDANLTRTQGLLTSKKYTIGGAYAGNYVIFAGGYKYDSDESNPIYYNQVDAIDMDTLTRTTATALSSQRKSMTGISVNDVAIFVGGSLRTGSFVTEVVTYNAELTQVLLPDFPNDKCSEMASVTVGSYGLVTGDLDLAGVVYAYTAN